MELLTLQQYDDAARRILSNYRKLHGYVYDSPDLIHSIVYAMAKADQKYSVELSNGHDEYSYRQQRAIYAIRKHVNLLKKQKKEDGTPLVMRRFYNPLEEAVNNDQSNMKSSSKIKMNFLLKNSGLSPIQLEIIQLYLSGSKIKSIAVTLNKDIKTIRSSFYRAIRKMKQIVRRGIKPIQ